jgi:hypothetical protein
MDPATFLRESDVENAARPTVDLLALPKGTPGENDAVALCVVNSMGSSTRSATRPGMTNLSVFRGLGYKPAPPYSLKCIAFRRDLLTVTTDKLVSHRY